MNDLSTKLTLANDLREQEKFPDSAREFTDCLIQQVDGNDYSGQIHSLCGHGLIYKILARKTGDPIYKELTLALSRAALTVLEAQQTTIDTRTQSICLSTFADALFLNSQFSESTIYYDRALKISPSLLPEKGRIKAHYGEARYHLGEKQEGIDLIESGLSDVRTGDLNSYNIRVWETGCLNSLAKIQALEGNLPRATQLIEESLKIASDHNLIIRKSEAEAIQKKLSSGETNFSL